MGPISMLFTMIWGYFDLETRMLEPLENPFSPKVLPMSQVCCGHPCLRAGPGPDRRNMAERVGFEPTVGVSLHTLSKRAP